MAATFRTREDVDPVYRWNLSSIYADDALWEADFRTIETQLPTLMALEGSLGTSGAALLAGLRLRDTIGAQVDKLFVYALFQRDEDTAHAAHQARADQVTALSAQFHAATAFIAPEILALDDALLENFFQDAPALEQYRFFLSDLRRRRAHIRSAEVEAVLAQAGEMAQAPETIFGALNDADLTFGAILDTDGSEIALSHGRVWSLLERPEQAIRQAAFVQYNAAYSAHRTTFAATLSSEIRARVFNARVRGYSSTLEAALYPNAIPPAVYHTLIDTVRHHLSLLHRYQRLRKRILGLDTLHFYDLMVPLSSAPMPALPYEDACELVLTALAPLGATYIDPLRRGLSEDRWVDVYETPHKRSGAYSWSAFDTQPFILLNWQDQFSDVFVFAHEIGHAMHTVFTRQTQPYVYSKYTIFVAEVASTCNEALLFAHLLRTTLTPDQRRYLLGQQLGNIAATLFQQTMFAEFEREVHARIERGDALAADHFAELGRRIEIAYSGSEVVPDDSTGGFWMVLPHFYMNFYVYQYATGIAAGLVFARQILNEGQPAVDRYLDFLRSGASRPSIDLLTQAGVDMTSAQPIEQAMSTFANLLEQLEALIHDTPVS